MHIPHDAARDADGENGQVSLGFVLDAARDVDHDAGVQFDLLVVEGHGAGAGDDVVELVGPFVVMQLGVVDLDLVYFAGGAVLLFDEATNLPAGFRPGCSKGVFS